MQRKSRLTFFPTSKRFSGITLSLKRATSTKNTIYSLLPPKSNAYISCNFRGTVSNGAFQRFGRHLSQKEKFVSNINTLIRTNRLAYKSPVCYFDIRISIKIIEISRDKIKAAGWENGRELVKYPRSIPFHHIPYSFLSRTAVIPTYVVSIDTPLSPLFLL